MSIKDTLSEKEWLKAKAFILDCPQCGIDTQGFESRLAKAIFNSRAGKIRTKLHPNLVREILKFRKPDPIKEQPQVQVEKSEIMVEKSESQPDINTTLQEEAFNDSNPIVDPNSILQEIDDEEPVVEPATQESDAVPTVKLQRTTGHLFQFQHMMLKKLHESALELAKFAMHRLTLPDDINSDGSGRSWWRHYDSEILRLIKSFQYFESGFHRQQTKQEEFDSKRTWPELASKQALSESMQDTFVSRENIMHQRQLEQLLKCLDDRGFEIVRKKKYE